MRWYTLALIVLFSAAPITGSGPSSDLDRGNSLFVLDQFDQALQVYQDVAAASGEDAPLALFLVGKCQTRLGRYEAAAQAYEQVLNDYPGTTLAAHAGNALGDTYAALGEWEKALEAYQRVAEQYRGSAEALGARFRLANNVYINNLNDSNADPNAAIENYLFVLRNRSDAVESGIDIAQVYFGIGEAFRNLGRYEDAIAYFEKARAEDADGIWGAAGQNMIGNLRLGMRQNQAAAAAYRRTKGQYRQQRAFANLADIQLDLLQRQGIRVDADRAPVTTEEGRWVRLLKGSVTVTGDNWRVDCDQAAWDPAKATLTCSENVRFHRNGELLFTAEELRFRVPAEENLILPTPRAPPAIRRNIEAMQQSQFPAMQAQE